MNKKTTIVIKKYANRRLYDTTTSSYVTQEALFQMIKDGLDFVVQDARTGEDITKAVLTNIIVEEEAKGNNLLPLGFLRQLLHFYGDQIQHGILPRYLDVTMQEFAKNQSQFGELVNNMVGYPFQQFEEMAKRNMGMFQESLRQGMRLLNPFGAGGSDDAETIKVLQNQIDELQKQLAALKKKG